MHLLDELKMILQQRKINAVFQPIINPEKATIIGYEGLTRGPSNSSLYSPLNLFDVAQRQGYLVELDILCRETVFRQFKQLDLPGKLFVNITPSSLLQADFRPGKTRQLLDQYGLSAEQIVIELTEHYPLGDYRIIQEAMSHYRSMGFQVALDDLGAGYCGLKSWLELRPDYVKLDQHFINQIHTDPVKLDFVKSITEMANQLKSQVIAEGIECVEEFVALQGLGIGLMQGYYFCRPSATPPKQLVMQPPLPVPAITNIAYPCLTIEDLALKVPTIEPDTLVKAVCRRFTQSPGLAHLVVVNELNYPIGMVQRKHFINLMLPQYAYDLYGYKPISHFMQEAVIVDSHEPLERVSQRLTAVDSWSNAADFIITKNQQYLGAGRILDLLQKITRLQILNARYANPLTLLPGNIPINQQVQAHLQAQQAFVIGYCDLNHFKPFNDVYDYSQGDRVIQKLAQILQQHSAPEQDFVGHIGGDDFVVIFRSPDWKQRCQHILEDFETAVPLFYTTEHQQSQGFYSLDRQGKPHFFPLLSLAIGAVVIDQFSQSRSYHEVANRASKAKTEAKKHAGNTLFVERRVRSQKIVALPSHNPALLHAKNQELI